MELKQFKVLLDQYLKDIGKTGTFLIDRKLVDQNKSFKAIKSYEYSLLYIAYPNNQEKYIHTFLSELYICKVTENSSDLDKADKDFIIKILKLINTKEWNDKLL